MNLEQLIGLHNYLDFDEIRVIGKDWKQDGKQSLRISLLLHVEIAKRDAQNNSYKLEGAVIRSTGRYLSAG